MSSKKTDRLAWYKLDAGSFITDTIGYSLAHRGAYAALLSLYWMSGCKPIEVTASLKRKLGITTEAEEAVLDEVLAEFFPEGIHDFLDNQLGDAKAYSEAQSNRAKKRFDKAETKASTTGRNEPLPLATETQADYDDNDF